MYAKVLGMFVRSLLKVVITVLALVLLVVVAVKTGVVTTRVRQGTVAKGEKIHLGSGNKSCPDCIVVATPEMVKKVREVVGR